MNKITLTPHIQGVIENAKKTSLMMHRHCVDMDLFFYSFMEDLSLSCSVLLDKYELRHRLLNASEEVLYKKRKNKTCSDKFDKKLILFFDNCVESCRDAFGIDYLPPEVIFMHFLDVGLAPHAIKKVILSDEELVNRIITDVTFSLSDVDVSSAIAELNKNGETEDNLNLDMFHENTILSQFAENLNLKAIDNKFDKIVDFDDKISEIATVLCRKKKPNVILVGSAGTGKTSLVEGLVNKIIDGEAPELLSNKVIYSVNLSSMVAGTTYRGQFEERLEQFVNEAKKYDNVILFIDEVHTLVGAGGTGGNDSLEASNILKPELARGTISCIGATTPNEYNETIKKDSALDRRFERVIVREPSKFQMKKILPAITSYYEEFHNVKYSKEFIDNIINYCERYNPNKHYPDKAVDVIDHCGAQAKVRHFELNPSLKEMQKNIRQMHEDKHYDNELFLDFEKKAVNWSEEKKRKKATVELSDLEAFFNRKSNPLSDNLVLGEVFEKLNKKFCGNPNLLKKLKEKIFLSNYNIDSCKSIPKVFCINGEEKTGKTHLLSLFKERFQMSGINTIMYNGSHFSDGYAPHKIASVVTNGVSLAEKILLYPNSVIIIDDFDCIDRSAIALFAQIFKDGKLELSNGECADFSHCKFFLTSKSKKSSALGFGIGEDDKESMVFSELSNHFEANLFLNKLDEKALRRVLWSKINNVSRNLKIKDVCIDFDFDFIKNFVHKNSGSDLEITNLNKAFDSKINKYVQSKLLDGSKKINLRKC